MAHVQVRCVNKQPRQDPHHGITHLGGQGWKWTRQQVVDSINARTNSFFTLVGGNRADVGVVDGPQTGNTFGPMRTANGTITYSRSPSAFHRRTT